MKTKIEIIEETVKFYTTERNHRSMNNGDCVYNGENGKHCAVGRCFTQDLKDEGSSFTYNDSVGVCELDEMECGLDSFLSEEYKGHDLKFWSQLQKLHDMNRFWDAYFTLSKEGEEHVNRLREEHS